MRWKYPHKNVTVVQILLIEPRFIYFTVFIYEYFIPFLFTEVVGLNYVMNIMNIVVT